MKAKILITLKSFEKISDLLYSARKSEFVNFSIFPPYAYEKGVIAPFTSLMPEKKQSSLIALPKKQTLFTVLRSPHIDKKSRDQFEYKIYKQLITFDIEIHQIREKLGKLKFHEIPGVQMKLVFQTKTRLCLNNGPKKNIS